MPTIVELKQRKAAAVDKAKAIATAAEVEGRELTPEQLEKVKAFMSEAKGYDGQIAAAEEQQSLLAEVNQHHAALSQPGQPRTVAKAGPVGATPGVSVKARFEDDPKRGFATDRDFYLTVMHAGSGGHVPENLESLRAKKTGELIKATAGSDEQSTFSDPYGGFMIPPAFSPQLKQVDAELDPMEGRTMQVPMQSPTLHIPARVDKDHSTSVSGGLKVYRRAEAASITESKMETELLEFQAYLLAGLAYATEEILRRSPMSVAALLAAGFKQEFASRKVKERLRGTGNGQYLGVLNSPCIVKIDKDTGQSADTILGENILKMRARCWHYSGAIWTANHDTLPELAQVHIAGTNGDVYLFAPGNGTDKPDTLLGRPIFFTEDNSTLGDEGDIVLGNWGEYLEGTLEEMESGESIHVRFNQWERAFRFGTSNAGMPWWRSALTPKQSAKTLSPFVTLKAR